MLGVVDQDNPEPTFKLLGRAGHSSGFEIKKDPLSHMSIYKVNMRDRRAGDYEVVSTDNRNLGRVPLCIARLYIQSPINGEQFVTLSCDRVLEELFVRGAWPSLK